jgi:hypothetical protein
MRMPVTISGMFDVRDAHHPGARVTVPPDFVFTSRVQLAWTSVAVGLHATLPSEPSSTTSTASPNPAPNWPSRTTPGRASVVFPQPWTIMTTNDIQATRRLPWDAADPYPFYEACRQHGNVVWNDTAASWLILGYHPARQILAGPGCTNNPLATPNGRAALRATDPDILRRILYGPL